MHPVGGGDDDRLDVLDDVAAELNPQGSGVGSQGVAEDGGGVGDGNGLGTAHGGDKLLAEDGGGGVGDVGGEGHGDSLCFKFEVVSLIRNAECGISSQSCNLLMLIQLRQSALRGLSVEVGQVDARMVHGLHH